MAHGENYESFVEKFKPKKTTDDCYTPPLVYDAVKSWVVNHYNLQRCEIVRPFYPGGDYQNYSYSENCIVIDNPPFSILAEIKAFYLEKNIKFFLFAPHLQLFSSNYMGIQYIVTNTTTTYENGAKVNTSFVTNLGGDFIRTEPELKGLIEQADKKTNETKKVPKYKYPDNVISSALLGTVSTVKWSIPEPELCHFVRSLDSQRPHKKAIFGSGFIIPDKYAYTLKQAKVLQARKNQTQKKKVEDSQEWELSEREKIIIKNLNEK